MICENVFSFQLRSHIMTCVLYNVFGKYFCKWNLHKIDVLYSMCDGIQFTIPIK